MRKILIVLAVLLLLALFAFSVQFFILKASGKGALQVTSTPKSNVYLNSTLIGQTPLCKCDPADMIASGEYSVRLVPIDTTDAVVFEKNVLIQKSILTVVDHIFGSSVTAESSIITLTPLKNAKDVELLVLSFPDKANVYLDNSDVGFTPLLLKNVTPSDHEVRLTKVGYREKVIRIKTTNGFKLESTIFLGISPEQLVTPTASPSASPTPKTQTVRILQTPTGFLRVRKDASISSNEIGRVNPGESYDLADELAGWYKIKLSKDKEGWVSASYAEKQ